MAPIKMRRKIILPVILLFSCAVDSTTDVLASGFADTIFVNGKILTVDEQFSIVEALAITDGKFSAVGKTNEINELAGPATEIIDLRGLTVVPGFIDGKMCLRPSRSI